MTTIELVGFVKRDIHKSECYNPNIKNCNGVTYIEYVTDWFISCIDADVSNNFFDQNKINELINFFIDYEFYEVCVYLKKLNLIK